MCGGEQWRAGGGRREALRETRAEELEIDQANRKMWEGVTEEGGRKDRNKSDRQTKSQLIPEESPLFGGVISLGNSAHRDRSL